MMPKVMVKCVSVLVMAIIPLLLATSANAALLVDLHFVGFQTGTAANGTTTINCEVKGNPGQLVQIEWKVNGVSKQIWQFQLDANGDFSGSLVASGYEALPGDTDELILSDQLIVTSFEEQPGEWVPGVSGGTAHRVSGAAVPALTNWGFVLLVALTLAIGSAALQRQGVRLG